jgi:hypothetical protein
MTNIAFVLGGGMFALGVLVGATLVQSTIKKLED